MRKNHHHRLTDLERLAQSRCKPEPGCPFQFARAEVAWMEGRGPKPKEPELVPPHTPESWASLLRLGRGFARGKATPDMTPAEVERLDGTLRAIQRSADRVEYEKQMELEREARRV